MSRFEQRRRKLVALIRKMDLDALLVTDFTNVTYLSGFTGDDSYMLVGKSLEILLSDPRYSEQLGEECPDLKLAIRRPTTNIVTLTSEVARKAKLTRIGVEASSMSLALFDQISAAVPNAKLVPTDGMVELLREIKDKDEVNEIRQAIKLAERVFMMVRAGLRPDQTEREIAYELEYQIRRLGGSGCAFPPIVAVGPRAALPHAVPTEQCVSADPLLLIDWGAKAHLYMSDLTRILVTGKISPKLERIYGVVLKAQEQAIAAIRPGALMSEVDAAARNVIAKAGYGKQFGHGLGHGFGLEIHETTRLAANQNRPLKAGMVITVEPGIYLPGWGGVRIEDDILVTRTGHEVLSELPKAIEQCVVG